MPEYMGRGPWIEDKSGWWRRLRVKNPLPHLPPPEGPAWREFTLLVLLLLTVAAASYTPLWDPDSFWHLAIGREMWQTGHLVRTETFSFTALGVPWADTEWLFHLIAYPLWLLGGNTATGLFTAAIAVLTIYLLYRCARLAGGDAASLTVYTLLMLGAFLARARFRPDLLSLVLFALLVEALARWKPSPPHVGRLWLFLGVLFCLWAQCHGGWTFGLALLGARLAGEFLDSLREKTLSLRYVAALSLTGLAPIAAVFLNPYGWKIPWFPIKSLIGFQDPTLVQIAEWQHTPFRGPHALFLIVCVCILLLLLYKWRNLDWRTLLVVASQAFLGWYWVRYEAFTVIALLPPFVQVTAPWLRRKPIRRFIWGISLATILVVLPIKVNGIKTAYDLTEKYPVQETAFIKAHGIRGNIYNSYVCGGYLDWELAGRCRVFMDGRYYPFIKAIGDYRKGMRSVSRFHAFLNKYPIDIVIYPYAEYKLRDPDFGRKVPPRDPSVVLFPPKDWALVYFGNYGELLLRREPRNAELISRFEYHLLRPADMAYLMQLASRNVRDRQELEVEIKRKLKEDPWTRFRSKLEESLAKLEDEHDTAR